MRLIFIFLIFISCKKETCQVCEVFLHNQQAYTYTVFCTGTPTFDLLTGETKSVMIFSGKDVKITGDLKSPYAHNDFEKMVRCPEKCEGLVLIMK